MVGASDGGPRLPKSAGMPPPRPPSHGVDLPVEAQVLLGCARVARGTAVDADTVGWLEAGIDEAMNPATANINTPSNNHCLFTSIHPSRELLIILCF